MSLQEIAEDLTVHLGAPVGISDVLFDTVAAGPHPLDVDWMRRESLLGRVAPQTSRLYYAERGVVPGMTGPLRTPRDDVRDVAPRWVLPVRWKGVTYGYVWVLDAEDTVSPEAVAALGAQCDRAGELFHRRTMTLRDNAQSLRQLLTGHRRNRHDTASDLYEVSGYPTGQVAVLVLSVPTPEGGRAALPRNVLDGPFPRAVPGDVWRFVDDTRAVLLAPPAAVSSAEGLRRVADHAHRVTSREFDLVDAPAPGGQPGTGEAVVVGIGDPVASLYEAHLSFRQARLAARAAAALHSLPAISSWSELGAVRALVSIPDDRLADAVSPGVVRLCKDAPVMAETLAAYFATGGNVQQTGEQLAISRGTVYYRLARAESLSGLSLRSGADRMALEVGLVLQRLAEHTTRTVAHLGTPAGASPL